MPLTRAIDLFGGRQGEHARLEAGRIDLDPGRSAPTRGGGGGQFLHARMGMLGVARADGLTGPDLVGWNGYLMAVDRNVPVRHDLARLLPRGGHAQPVNDVVEPRLQQLEQPRARDALCAGGALEVGLELRLVEAIDPAQLLLLT